MVASRGPVGDVSLHLGPDVPFGNQTMRGLDARMRQRVQFVKDGSTHRQGHYRTRMALGDITKKSSPGVRKRYLCELQ